MASVSAPTPIPGTQSLVARLTAWGLQFSVVRASLRYAEHRGPMLADSITYRALFSVFAALLLGFSVLALWLGGNPEQLREIAKGIDTFVPGLTSLIDVTAIQAPVGFSIVGAASVIALVGAALSAIRNLSRAFWVLSDATGPEPKVMWVLLRNGLVGVLFVALLLTAVFATLLSTTWLHWVGDWFGIDSDSRVLIFGTRIVGVVVSLAVNTLAVCAAFRVLSGVAAPARALWSGALLGGVGLLVLQEFSALFVRGATANPLLASFAVLISLLLWMNLSCQVVLFSASLIVTLTAESHDRVRLKFGARTLVQRRRLRAEQLLSVAKQELRAAQDAERAETEKIAEKAKAHATKQQHKDALHDK